MSSEVIVGNCDKCKVVRAMFKCSGCSGVRYCSKECQREDWKSSHRHVCKELSSIALKWKEQGNFVRFVDGNIRNYMASNLCYVDLLDALQHVNDWAVDWDMELTEAERAIVVDPCNRSSLLASYAYHQYQKTRPTTWNPQVDGVEVFAISEEGSEFCRMYSSAMTGPLKNVTLVALNVPWSIPMAIDSQGAPKHAVNAGEAAHAVEGFMLLLHCRAAQGIPVKENQMLEQMRERHPPEGYLTIRPSPGDEAKLRQDLCIQMSEAFEQAEALGNAKILVMLPLIGNQEGKHSYDHLLPVVSDLINCPIADNGLAGSDLGGGSSRRFKHKENVDQVSAPEL